jgi:hypothetical protein
MKEVIKISGRKNTKQYVEVCEICGAQYIATRTGSHVCSNVCRAQKARNKHVKQFKAQDKIIKVQSEVIEAVLTKSVDIKPVLNNTNQRGNKSITPSMIEYQNNKAIEALLDSHPTKEDIIKNRALAKERLTKWVFNEAQLKQIIHDLTLMSEEARQLAVSAGQDTGRWPKYLKEPNRYYELSTTMIKLLR